MRIYISGRMTGCPDLNRPAFDAAEKRLSAQGHFVINPHRIGEQFGTPEELAAAFAAAYAQPWQNVGSYEAHARRMRLARSVVEKMAENMNRDGVAASVTDEKGVRTEAATPGDRRCERNMKRDRVAYVRTDITGCTDGIHVKLSVMNPRVVVGNAELFAREYAVMCARILIYLREAITTARIVLIEGEGAQDVYADAEAMNRRDDLAKMRASCDRLHNGNCSPCKFDCPLYRNGKCLDPMKEDV